MSSRNYNRKTYSYICLAVFLIIIMLLVVGVFIPTLEFLIVITIPLIITIAIAYVVIRFSWERQKHCPRCNIPVTAYAEFCKNCGLKLINRCPNCNKYIRGDQRLCGYCGYSFEGFEEVKETPQYVIVERGSPASIIVENCLVKMTISLLVTLGCINEIFPKMSLGFGLSLVTSILRLLSCILAILSSAASSSPFVTRPRLVLPV